MGGGGWGWAHSVFAWLANALAADDAVAVEALCDAVEDLLPQPAARASSTSARQADTEVHACRVTLRSFVLGLPSVTWFSGAARTGRDQPAGAV